MKYLIIGIFALFSFRVFSQNIDKSLIPKLIGKKYGYATEEKKLVIDAKYDFAYPFFQGYELTFAIKDNKPQLINRKGIEVLKGTTDYLKSGNISEFFDKYGYDLDEYCNSEANPEIGIIDNTDYGLFFDKFGKYYIVKNSDKVFLIDKDGKIISKLYDKMLHESYPGIEYCYLQTDYKKDDGTKYSIFGLMDTTGNVIIEKNCSISRYVNKIEIRGNGETKTYNFKSLELKKNEIQDKKDWKFTRQNDKVGVSDTLGNLLIKPVYIELVDLSENRFAFLKDSVIGILNIKGDYVFTEKISRRLGNLTNSSAIKVMMKFTDSLVFFNIDNKWKMVDIKGNKKLSSYDQIYIDEFKEFGEIAGVCKKNKLGVIDKNGNEIIPVIYDKLTGFEDTNLLIGERSNKWELIDNKGKIIYKGFDNFILFPDTYIYVHKDKKWFFIDKDGNEFFDYN
jgi:hypothetical protein